MGAAYLCVAGDCRVQHNTTEADIYPAGVPRNEHRVSRLGSDSWLGVRRNPHRDDSAIFLSYILPVPKAHGVEKP